MKFLGFACASCIFLAASAHGQAVSKAPSDPFRIDRGSSFSASTKKPTTPEPQRPTSTPVAAGIISDIQQALEIIKANHTNGSSLDNNELTKSSISAMLNELDPHSSYFDAAEFGELLGEEDSEYSGTGSTISNYLRNGAMETFVIATHPDSAAAKAGLKYGDRIISVNGTAVSGRTSEDVRDRVRGPRGTTVTMTIERAATGKIETVQMKRERIFQPTLPNFFLVRDGVGYIDLSEGFSHTTSTELESALRELHRRGMTSLVLDLRGNPGGILDEAVRVAERFLPVGRAIISQKGRSDIDNREWRSSNRNPETMPLVILVDGGTASASEVVAGAMQDNDRALILGQNTFGKGLVQNVVGLPLGAGLTITTARYYTPSGRSIQRTYSGSGLYDYFNHRGGADEAELRKLEARTITNRPVFGGNGIAPDEKLVAPTFGAKKAVLLDPIFYFVRKLIAENSTSASTGFSTRDRVRQSIIFGGEPVGNDMVDKFREFATANNGWKIPAATINQNREFIADRLNRELSLATFGPEAAKHSQINNDPEVARAIELLPQAGRLAEAARRARTFAEQKKTRRVAFPAGQGRNRRN